MKEQFENRRFIGTLSVKCKNDDGTSRTWTAEKATVVNQIVATVEKYQDMGYPLTLRQLHYQFVSQNWIVNHITAYKKLGKILDDCRYGGLIDWDAIEDRGRETTFAYYEHSVPAALERTKNCYRLDRQIGQENHVEVWTEKDALSNILGKVTNKYTVGLAVNKGYTSSSAIYEAYQRFLTCYRAGQKVIILYFGDHDPSGLDMVRDVRERLELMFRNGNEQGTDIEDWLDDDGFQVIQIGLNMKQIKKYKLPPNPAKLTDSRSDKYIEQFGAMSWEVDALEPQVLAQIVEEQILAHIDNDMVEEIKAQEIKDKETITKFIKKTK